MKCGKGLDHVVVLSGLENLGPTEASLHTLVTWMIEALNQRFAFLTTTPYLQFSILDHQVMPPIHAAAQLYMYGNIEIRTLVDHLVTLLFVEKWTKNMLTSAIWDIKSRHCLLLRYCVPTSTPFFS